MLLCLTQTYWYSVFLPVCFLCYAFPYSVQESKHIITINTTFLHNRHSGKKHLEFILVKVFLLSYTPYRQKILALIF